MGRKNTIGIVGKIAATPELIVDAADWSRKVYETKLTRSRASGKKDIYFLRFSGYAAGSEELLGKIAEGTEVMAGGEIRSENIRNPLPGENRVKVYIAAEVIAVNDPPANDQNEVCICGRICKPPHFWQKKKKEESKKKIAVTSITVAVNTAASTSYIPCVCFGNMAFRAVALKVGDYVEIYGRLQSRDYKKQIEGKELPYLCTAYEVGTVKMKSKGENDRTGKENQTDEDTKRYTDKL